MAANPLVPFGFRIARQFNANPTNMQLNVRQIAFNNANQIAYGDPVKSLSTGFIDLMTVGGTTIHGVLLGVNYPNATAIGGVSFPPNWAAVSGLASTAVVTALVANDPNLVFMAQCNGAAQTVAAVGQNIDIKTGTSGAPNGAGISTCALDATTIATTATLPFRIVGIVGLSDLVNSGAASGIGPIPQYVATNDNQFFYVTMNTSDMRQVTGI